MNTAGRVMTMVVMLSAWPVAARAQQAPTQAPPPPPPVFAGSAEFSAVATTGNSSTQSLGAATEVIYRPSGWRVDGKAAFVRNKAEGVVSARTVTTLARVSRELNTHVSVFGQHDYLRNVFAGIRQRNSLAAGVSAKAIESDRQTLLVDAALGYQHERRVVGDRLSSATALGGGQYTLKLSETSELGEALRVITSLEDTSDWRLDQNLSLTAQVTSVFSLKVSHVVRFVNAPAVGFEKTDTIASAALVAKF